ncbi:hypothetical protein FB567DRAFT_587812 [Paraphoma chrysanthemicola]|uniref:Uncharacterized protein n=1 Tax=Paraphoma chrysanthemicola TaxID=798071 RepID=A0A8K0W3F2_9PLEO|nr:hypothetical protein FB567DRAFT_587812 [Paraphoma chrysanthemicola]
MTQGNTKTSAKLTAHDRFDSQVQYQKKRRIILEDSEDDLTLAAARPPKRIAKDGRHEKQDENLGFYSSDENDDDISPSSPRTRLKLVLKEKGEGVGPEGVPEDSHDIRKSTNALDMDISDDQSEWEDMDESSGDEELLDSSLSEQPRDDLQAQHSRLQEGSDNQSAGRAEMNPSDKALPKYLALLLRRRVAQEHGTIASQDAALDESAPVQKNEAVAASYPRPSENDHCDEIMTALSWRARDRHRKTGMHPFNRPLEDMNPAFKRV